MYQLRENFIKILTRVIGIFLLFSSLAEHVRISKRMEETKLNTSRCLIIYIPLAGGK